jgi:hypothetical protein
MKLRVCARVNDAPTRQGGVGSAHLFLLNPHRAAPGIGFLREDRDVHLARSLIVVDAAVGEFLRLWDQLSRAFSPSSDWRWPYR